MERVGEGRKKPGTWRRLLGQRQGFTLLELTVVLIIVAVVMGLSTVYFVNTLPSTRLTSGAREMSAVLRYARMAAKNSGEPKTVVVDLDGRTYGVEGMKAKTVPPGIGMKIADTQAGDVYRGSYSFTFQETGAVEGASIILWNAKRTITIQIDPIVGAAVLR